MAIDYRDEEDILKLDVSADETRATDLDPDVVPESIGVYDRPDEKPGKGLSVASIVGIVVVLVIAFIVLSTLF